MNIHFPFFFQLNHFLTQEVLSEFYQIHAALLYITTCTHNQLDYWVVVLHMLMLCS